MPLPKSNASKVLWSTSTRHWQPQGPMLSPGLWAPAAPTPGTRGSKGTGSEEAGGTPELPQHDPPC